MFSDYIVEIIDAMIILGCRDNQLKKVSILDFNQLFPVKNLTALFLSIMLYTL